MPQIPRIEPEVPGTVQAGPPSLDPAAFARLSTSGLRAAGAALGQAASAAKDIYTEQQRVEKELATEQRKLETEQALGAYDRAAADALFTIKTDPNIPPEDYAQRVETELRKVKDQSAKNIRTPGVLPHFELGVERKITSDVVKAKYDGYERRLALNQAGAFMLNGQDETLAAKSDDPVVQQEAVGRITDRLDRQLLSGSMTRPQYDAALKQSLRNIEEGTIERKLRNEATRKEVMDTLLIGGYKTIPYDEQLKKAKTISDEDDRLRKARADADEKLHKKNYDQLISTLTNDADQGKLTEERFNQLVTEHHITLEHQNAIRRIMRADPNEKEKPSTPTVWSAVIGDVWSMKPKMTQAQLDKLHQDFMNGGEGLNTKNYQDAVSRLRQTRVEEIRFGQSLAAQQRGVAAQERSVALQAHAQGEQMLRAHLGIPTDMSRANDDQKKLWAEALTEYTSLSSVGGLKGTMDPGAAALQVIAKYRAIAGTSTNLSVQQQWDVLRFKSIPELDKAYKDGKIREGERDVEREKIIRLKRSLEDRKTLLEPKTSPEANLPKTGGSALPSPIDVGTSLLHKGQTRNAPAPGKRPGTR